MGALHRLVDLLQKLDPNNESWKRDRLTEAERYRDILRESDAPREEVNQYEARIEDIRKSFDKRYHALDFARKLYIIENCIYGVDIQPIATQIAKLRFFISLIVDQQVNRTAPNLGVRPLPNLETKIVAADALIPLEKPHGQMDLLDSEIRPLRIQLAQVRHEHFNARTPSAKARCRQRDAELRAGLADLLKQNGLPGEEAKALAAWDPYDQNHAAPFFDTEWMFGGDVKSGFDIVTGNPPYVRIQTLKQQNPEVAEFYREHYESARKGNYDLYVVFVEAGLGFLKPNGNLAYILPHKFFNAQYGEPLRGLIAKGRYLKHVVHFGDQQVFPGATNYVCLLFLDKAGCSAARFVRSDSLADWLRTFKGTEATFPADRVNASEWNFTVGSQAEVFNKLSSVRLRLGEVAPRIFQGPITSADGIFLFKEFKPALRGIVSVVSKELGEWVQIEAAVLKSVVRSGDIGPFWAKPEALVLFPYEVRDNEANLYSASEMEENFPNAFRYLKHNRKRLESREDYKFKDDNWFRFGRTQNLGIWEQPKIMVPYMITRLSAYLDISDHYYFINVTTGGYGITTDPSKCSLGLLCGLMNSHVLDFYLKRISTNFHGGYFAANKQYIEQLPIASATPEQETQIVRLVNYLSWLNRDVLTQDAKATRDSLMLSWWEQVLNGLVYELYFPTELHTAGIHLFELLSTSSFPELNMLPESERLPRLRAEFERTYDTSHPLRGALFNLGSLEAVRVIEGRE